MVVSHSALRDMNKGLKILIFDLLHMQQIVCYTFVK
jgi:hypothetical protein